MSLSDIKKNMPEMKRKELIAYDKWLTRRKWGTGEIISPEKAADLYLAEHPLPPAEGAEEILKPFCERDDAEDFLQTKDIWNHPRISDRTDKESYEVAHLMAEFAQEFATLHAQKIADKMVEDMRQKLFSMRATKKTMDMLSEADRLITYGYHDCINEMLMWTKSRDSHE